MTQIDVIRILAYTAALTVLGPPLGAYLAKVYTGGRTFLDPLARPVEGLIYKLAGVKAEEEMDWKANAVAMLVFNAAGFILVYALQRLQDVLPLNTQALGAITPDSSFNTAVSFTSNTNWQGYAGESTMSMFTQMFGFTVQNFLSAATGMAVLVLFVRGLARHSTKLLGNFWVDLTRSIMYVLLPLSFIFAIVLVSEGVVQNFTPPVTFQSIEQSNDTDEGIVRSRTLPMGPVASQIAIKQLGTNGGGYFNTNSAHPFENPTPVSNFLEMFAILILPAAFVFAFGIMVDDRRQGWAVFTAMLAILVVFIVIAVTAEQQGNPLLKELGIDQNASPAQCGGNMEGKELRFGIGNSALWASVTTAASNGSVNSMHDSFTPLGGGVAMFLIQLGEVVFGGIGSGLYGMLVFVIIAVFVAGLLVGRTPEYLGHKIEAYEMKLASLLILTMPIVVLTLTALAVATRAGSAAIFNSGPHGFSEMLYAFTSQANNNGSAFAGISANNPFYNYTGGIAMIAGRFWLAVPTLALAGALASKRRVPVGQGTLPTHTPLFVGWLIAVVLLVGALNFLPALALGPIAEHLLLP